MIRVTYRVGKLNTTVLTLHEDFESATAAFEVVKAIIHKENIGFPDADRTCDGYMLIVYKIAKGDLHKNENYFFSVEHVKLC